MNRKDALRRWRQMFGCGPATMAGTLLIVLTTAAWAQGTVEAKPLDEMTAAEFIRLLLTGGWPAVTGWLGHRTLRLLENGAKAAEAGKSILRIELVHRHDVRHVRRKVLVQKDDDEAELVLDEDELVKDEPTDVKQGRRRRG